MLTFNNSFMFYKHGHLWVLVMMLMLLNACSMKDKADTIIYNGKIYTVDQDFSVVNAMVLKDKKVWEVGDYSSLTKKYSTDHEIDLGGKFVYPGFYDGHCHFLGYGLNLNQVDLTGTTSFDEIIDKLIEHQKQTSSTWIIGRGWDQNDWENPTFPTKDLLDRHFPDKPVFLTRIDGHAALVNTVSLNIAGITAETDVEGGQVISENGELTGILIDKAIQLVSDNIPEPGLDQKKAALIQAEQHCFSVGLTSVADAGLLTEDIRLIQSMHNDSLLKIRIYAMLTPTDENIEKIIKKGIIQTQRLTVRSLKLFADGALGSRGALLLEPYADDPGNTGLLLNDKPYLTEMCNLAYDYDYQVNTHCIGDSANRLMLNIYSNVLNQQNDRRWRIEHAQIVHPDDFEMFGRYSIIPSIQTTHATSDMYWADERLGPERMQGAYAYQDLLQQNGWLVNGSDFPVESINPLLGFYAAVARQDLKQYPTDGFLTENRLTREQALRAMTIWAAKAGFEEHFKGSLEPGKFADFVVLNQDLMKVELQKIPQLKIQQTFVDGIPVYSAER
jgi:predicted amidohydrolase YtcJ